MGASRLAEFEQDVVVADTQADGEAECVAEPVDRSANIGTVEHRDGPCTAVRND
jgi:hypothetical protein